MFMATEQQCMPTCSSARGLFTEALDGWMDQRLNPNVLPRIKASLLRLATLLWVWLH